MGLYRDELPPVEILKKLSEVCNQIARDSKAGIPVDLEKFVAEFPIEYRDDVAKELGLLLEEIQEDAKARAGEGGSARDKGRAFSNRYRIIEPLTQGGMGQIAVAFDRDFDRRVALKELQEKYAADEKVRRRFIKESRVTASLEHPGILPVYSCGKAEDEIPYYTMRLISGENTRSLHRAINELHKNRIGDEEYRSGLRVLLQRLIDVCNTVAFAHSRGICHRDLKPANILIGPFGETFVVDWGLAKNFFSRDATDPEPIEAPQETTEIAPSDAASEKDGLTPTQAVGTRGFVAPECLTGESVKNWPKVDVYSLGAVLYSMLVGSSPSKTRYDLLESKQSELNPKTPVKRSLPWNSSFGIRPSNADMDLSFVDLVRGDLIPTPRKIQPKIPKLLEAICLKAMEMDPDKRYQGPLDLAADLDRYLANEPVSVLPESWIEQASRWANKHRGLVASSILSISAFAAAASSIAWITTKTNAELQEKSARLELAIQQKEQLRQREQGARQRAEQQETAARKRESMAIAAIRSFSDAISNNEVLKNSDSLREVRLALLDKPIQFFKQIQEEESNETDPSSDYLIQLARTSDELAKLSFEYGDLPQCATWADRAIERYDQLVERLAEGQNKPSGTNAEENEAAQKNQLATFQISLADCYRLRGTISMLSGQMGPAEKSLSQASQLFESIGRSAVSEEQFLEGRARLNALLGILAAEKRNPEELVQRFNQGIEDRQELVRLAESETAGEEQGGASKKDLRTQELLDLIQDESCMYLLLRIGPPEIKFQKIREYIQELERRLALGLSVEHTRLRLAWANQNLAIHLRNHGFADQALDLLKQASMFRSQLVENYSSVVRYRTDQASTFSETAATLAALGKLSEAIKFETQSTEIYRKLISDMPKFYSHRFALSASLHNLGHYLIENLDDAQSRQVLRESLEECAKFVEQNNTTLNAIRLLSELRRHEREHNSLLGEWEKVRESFGEIPQQTPGAESNNQPGYPTFGPEEFELWILSCEREGDQSAAEVLRRLRDGRQRNSPESIERIETQDKELAKIRDTNSLGTWDPERLNELSIRAYQLGDFPLSLRLNKELLQRLDSETDPALLENLVTRLGAPRWKVLVTCASASLRLKPLSDSDVKQSLEWMKRAVQEIQANPPSDEKLAWIKSIWNETVRNPVFAPVGLSKKIRSESGATNLESEWDSIWQALFDLKN